MCMADRFNISEANRILIIDMLNEPMLDDYDFIGIAEKSIRMRKLFGVDEETYMSAQLEVSAMAKIIGAIEAN